MTEVYILFGASVAVMFLAIVTLFVVVNYHKTLQKQRALEEEVKLLRSQGSEEARKIIFNAHTQATEVIKGAELKAQELLRASDIFSKEYKQSFQASIQNETNKMLVNMSQTVSSQVDAEVKQIHGSFEKTMNSLLAQAEANIEEYKKVMLQRVNSAIFSIVQSVVKKSLKESLSREQHEKIIIKALEEAKKQNVL